MRLNLSRNWRVAIYVTNILIAPVMAYLRAKDIIGDLELNLWASEVAAAFTLSGLNVRS